MGETHECLRVTRCVPEGQVGATVVTDGSIRASPGQFFMVWLPGVAERPYTIVDDDPVTFTVVRVGPFSRALAGLSEGDKLWARGPYGRGFRLGGQRPLLLGGGSGVASLALLAKELPEKDRRVRVVVGARTSDALILVDHLSALRCELLVATDDGSSGRQGSCVEVARDAGWLSSADALYACGPEAMLGAVCQVARALGVPCQVSMERTLKCGIGVCGACHCGEHLVCRDGPVFDCSEVAAFLETGAG